MTVSGSIATRLIPVGDAHDRLDDRHRAVEQLELLRLVRRAPDVGVGGVRLLDRRAIREAALEQPLAHLLAPAELGDELRVEPRLVDPEGRVREQPVAEEALDVVALVRRPVAPDVDAVLAHRMHEHRPGDGAPERRRVEVRLAGARDVEGAALQRDEPLVRRAAPGSRRAPPPRRRTRARAREPRRRPPRRTGRDRP